MEIFYTIKDLENFVYNSKSNKKTIGFVPTMGALHQGHISLILKSKSSCDLTIVSIFVNPKQFNNPLDFQKYPIKTKEDIQLLENNHCDVLFLPTKDEIYSKEYKLPSIDIGILDQILEGKYRPSHFQGVIQVVYRLFEIVKPDRAFFGLKDFQQVAVIKKMVEYFKLPVEIIPCTTIREKDGLAMSSRNLRLNPQERMEALFIYKSLILAKKMVFQCSPSELKKFIEEQYKKSPLRLEYFEIINPTNFKILSNKWSKSAVACIVAYVGDVRLIDNLQLI